jgi:hypothetical protein
MCIFYIVFIHIFKGQALILKAIYWINLLFLLFIIVTVFTCSLFEQKSIFFHFTTIELFLRLQSAIVCKLGFFWHEWANLKRE